MKLSRISQHMALGLLILTGFAGSVVVAEPTQPSKNIATAAQKTAAGGNVQGYAADSVLQTGTIVQLSGGGANKVTPATSKNLNQMYGVTVDPHELSVTVSDASLLNEAFVATSGTFNVLVSSQGGVIKAGDYITLSAIDGVGMKASTDELTLFGRASYGFDGKSNVIGNSTLKDTTGHTNQTIALGVIPVAINIQRNQNQKSTKANLPGALQRTGEAVAEKPIGPLRIYLSLFIVGLSIIVATVTLYAGIRNSIIAIGRNPLTKRTIMRGLIEVILASFIILIIGLFAVYLLLKL